MEEVIDIEYPDYETKSMAFTVKGDENLGD